jgi:hypothetical protein
MACCGVTFTFKCFKEHFLRTKHNPSSYDCMIRSLEPRLMTTVTGKTGKYLGNQAECLLLWAGARVEHPSHRGPNRSGSCRRHHTSEQVGDGQQCAGTDQRLRNSKHELNGMEANPAQLLHLCPLRPHDQIVSPPLSIEVKNNWSHTSAPTTCLHGLEKENFTVVRPVSKVGLIKRKANDPASR